MIAVDGCAEVRHAVDAANLPATTVFQAAGDHMAACSLGLTAADGSAFGQSLRILQVFGLPSQIGPELFQRRAARGFPNRLFGFPQMSFNWSFANSRLTQ